MNENENKTSSVSQNKQILAHLKKGFSVTAIPALHMFGCMRLASRIHDLKSQGHNIVKNMIKNPDNGKRYAQYTLIP